MRLKKLTCIFLALILALGGLLGLTVSAADAEYEKNCPLIYVEGFMSETIYKNPGTAGSGLAAVKRRNPRRC